MAKKQKERNDDTLITNDVQTDGPETEYTGDGDKNTLPAGEGTDLYPSLVHYLRKRNRGDEAMEFAKGNYTARKNLILKISDELMAQNRHADNKELLEAVQESGFRFKTGE